ncbi:MAG: class I SAM-dependent methyltransferase [Chloroflexota bacterium]|nr:class I SAM-dependent methyltransferase [Chloroflexota bacterium]MDE2919472.1 class I SAM-dependent methyltransferase [Chloroflexota bacterium]
MLGSYHIVNQSFVRESWEDASHVREYAAAVTAIELWDSERLLIDRYLPRDGAILDIGCGAGRTTFGMYEAGYRRLTGLDLSTYMIAAARRIAAERDLAVRFDIADATSMPYDDASFDGALFSFQGLMCIPGGKRRLKVLREVRRVLWPDSHFVFTTHDRDLPRWIDFWRKERDRWDRGNQDPRLLEFGDRIIPDYGLQTYIHIPTRAEVARLVADAGFILVEDRLRSELAVESETTRNFSAECRMWVARRPQEPN